MRCFLILSFTIIFFSCSDPGSPEPFKNSAPQILSLWATPDSVEPNASILVFCSAQDPDGQELTYDWQSEFGTVLGRDSVATYVAPDFICRPWIYCTISDTYGAEDKDSMQVFIVD